MFSIIGFGIKWKNFNDEIIVTKALEQDDRDTPDSSDDLFGPVFLKVVGLDKYMFPSV